MFLNESSTCTGFYCYCDSKKRIGGNVWFYVTYEEHHEACLASAKPANNQLDYSRRLSSKITVMAVCLTFTVTYAMLLLYFPSLTLPL